MKKVIFILLPFFSNSARWYLANPWSRDKIKQESTIYPQYNASMITTPEYISDGGHYYSQKISADNNINAVSKGNSLPEDFGKENYSQYTSLKNQRQKNNLRRCVQRKRVKNSGTKENRTSYGRFLEVFEVVEFDHLPCKSSSGLDGTCVHEFDCRKNGVQFTCDTRSATPTGWFTNDGFPLPSYERLSCTVTFDKVWPDVKQIRLDFLSFEMLPPTFGNCERDQFIITGQNINNIIPILCGINTGQHVYIEVGNAVGPINISIQTVTTDNRLFAIKVTQLRSTHPLAAPTGCLQYHLKPQGYLESFNYRDTSEIVFGKTSSYLNNLNYAICIQRSPDACSTTYTNVGSMQIVNFDFDNLPIIPPRQAGVEIYNCPSDWLLIAAVRLCGDRLNDGSTIQDFSLDAPVVDDGVGPIVIWFRTDSVYTGRGFKLSYQQNSCSNERICIFVSNPE
ncbi:unnamed protein product [Leptosia nina]|uniref:CUB domain-containing protein n=1 Tax=Leptosia nina TaxID=320188 RepID=A0AAV1K0H9_9NEOP